MQLFKFCMYCNYTMSVECPSLFVPASALSVSLLFSLSGVYFRFVITEHQPPFLFWSWRYLAGTVMSAHLLILLSAQHGLQIYSIYVFLYPHHEFFLCWNAAPSCTVVHVSVVLRPSFSYMCCYCTECCFWYYPLCFLWGLPCFSSSGWCFFSLCSGAETDSNQLLKIEHNTEINMKLWMNE